MDIAASHPEPIAEHAAPAPQKAAPSGFFEVCTAREVSGWAVASGGPASLDIFVGDEYLARVECTRPRADIEAASGAANAGFSYRLPGRLRLPPAAMIAIRHADGTELSDSPRFVPRAEGHIDTLSRTAINGWAAWDGAPAELSIEVDGERVARIRCAGLRPDVAASRGLPEPTGFAYLFPAPVADTATVSVRFPDGSALGELRGLDALDPCSPGAYDRALAHHRARSQTALEALENRLRRAEDQPAALDEPGHLRVMRDILRAGLFDAEFYLRDNPDIRDSGADPLEHYVRHGDAEGRRPNPVFWPFEYRLLNAPACPPEANALADYANIGERLGRRASLAFDPHAYLAANPMLAPFAGRPLFHFLTLGRAARLPVRLFDPAAPRPPGHKATPRIAAQLEVKDEVEIIERTIAHLRAIGVDHIIAIDVGSTDGTAEILDKYRAEDFWVRTLSDRAVSLEATPEDDEVFESYKTAPADWVIHLDADEFWLPASGSLKICEALDRLDVLSVRRYNVALGQHGPIMPEALSPSRYGELLLVAEPLPDFRKHLMRHPETSSLLGAEEPKIMVRPEQVGAVITGSHDVVDAAHRLRRATAGDLLIAHLPLSTRRRFDKRVANICALLARDGVDLLAGPGTWQNEAIAWHWRRWAALAQAGKLAEEFQRNLLGDAKISEMRALGTLRSAAEILAQGVIVPPRT